MKILQIMSYKKSGGYTIIETMVAVSIFLVVILFGMDTLLNANLVHNKSEDIRSVMDNLSFIMDDISRNLRTGYNYHCGSVLSGYTETQDCLLGGGVLAFEAQSGDPTNLADQWVYKIYSNDGNVTYDIAKSTNSGATWVNLNTDEIKIDSNKSGFWVTGAEKGSADDTQPLATVRLTGVITYKNIDTPFSLQTSVSQRLLDTVD